MRVDELINDERGDTRQTGGDGSRAPGRVLVGGPFIKAEANLLRLPLFALHTKRLKTLDGIECRGRITRDGQTHQFVFRATRNTATLYPGPLARSAHLAFLSLITERGFPLENPLRWRWRDLCRRMGVVYGGQMVQHLKEAITATAGLLLSSESALYAKAESRPLRTQQEALHLYERVAFIGTPLPDGTPADTNYLWLADWYLQNLNALFTAPLDYDLWRHLDLKSSIASRLYEFLLLNFYSGAPVLTIHYETLTQFLPVRPERYLSDAHRQLDAALTLLQETDVLHTVLWAESRTALVTLHFHRGPKLSAPSLRLPGVPTVEEFAEAIHVKELRNLKPPAWSVVTEFYRLWTRQENYRPTKKELGQAEELLAQHGQPTLKALLPLVVRRLQEKWPEAKTFGAAARYLPEVAAEYEREQRRREREREDLQREQQEQEQRSRKRAEEERFAALWQQLPESERQEVRHAVLQKQPHLAKHPKLVERFCLAALAARAEKEAAPAIPRER